MQKIIAMPKNIFFLFNKSHLMPQSPGQAYFLMRRSSNALYPFGTDNACLNKINESYNLAADCVNMVYEF